jgi:demethoxyubiquinone hydroxylase (CLK1/Coq7/Cat5 family)
MIRSTNNLATLVYTKAIEDRVKSKYLKRIDYLVEANNELMAELEQWERVGERLEKATEEDSLSPEETQIVRMPWLKEHTI